MTQDQPSPNPPTPAATATATAATPPTTTTTRRVPPPCWTHEETVALIDAYHEKWYSLRRGNLKASHWQDVADAVARRCRFASPSKTSVQCRHKIEKLRKRYRTEKQRSLLHSHNRSFVSSSWVFFRQMEAMENGQRPRVDHDSNNNNNNNDDDDEDNDEDEDRDDEDQDDGDDDDARRNPSNSRDLHRMMSNGSGFTIRISGGQRSVGGMASGDRKQKSFLVKGNENPSNPVNPNNPNCGSGARFSLNGCSWARSGDGNGGGGGRKREGDPVAQMVSSIRMLGEGFVRMEQMKIETAREMEQMRMDMEMKRTEMILESHRQIVEAFAKGEFSGKKKKAKRIASSPDS